MVAHELASPLAAIRYLTNMVMAGHLAPEEQSEALAAISAETEVLQALIRDVESAVAARGDDFVVYPELVGLAALLAEPLSFARTLPGEHPLITQLDIESHVLADRRRIGQVLRNLLGNAAKYSPPGTPIAVRAVRAAHRVRIEVADRGPGVPLEDRSRIFEMYERGRATRNSRVPGLGLGLYVSRCIVQMHGSELTLEPRPGGGAIFSFDLERAGGEPAMEMADGLMQ
jgi:signal transduction histidine kinase